MKQTIISSLRAKWRKGFSLIEVNMAIFVLAGGALALLALFPAGLRFSKEAHSEMRTTAMAQRFLGAVRIAAMDVDATSIEALAGILQSDFNITVSTAGAGTDSGSDIREDESGVFYKAWLTEDSPNDYADESCKRHHRVQAGIQVTAENWRQNRRAFVGRPVSVVEVLLPHSDAH